MTDSDRQLREFIRNIRSIARGEIKAFLANHSSESIFICLIDEIENGEQETWKLGITFAEQQRLTRRYGDLEKAIIRHYRFKSFSQKWGLIDFLQGYWGAWPLDKIDDNFALTIKVGEDLIEKIATTDTDREEFARGAIDNCYRLILLAYEDNEINLTWEQKDRLCLILSNLKTYPIFGMGRPSS